MSLKSKGRRLGRMIRRITGIKLPIAMRIGKMAARDKASFPELLKLSDKFPEDFKIENRHMDCPDCNGEVILKGKRGSIDAFSISETAITKEYRIHEKLAAAKPGETVTL